ncbi:MAG: hypothetical protein WA996_21315 [Candidatus Promineifilaceae bacterium]
MNRSVPHQTAIIDHDHILFPKVSDMAGGQTFWIISGGTRDPGESEEVYLRCEVGEETITGIETDLD